MINKKFNKNMKIKYINLIKKSKLIKKKLKILLKHLNNFKCLTKIINKKLF